MSDGDAALGGLRGFRSFRSLDEGDDETPLLGGQLIQSDDAGRTPPRACAPATGLYEYGLLGP
jgi:hypothetical protein